MSRAIVVAAAVAAIVGVGCAVPEGRSIPPFAGPTVAGGVQGLRDPDMGAPVPTHSGFPEALQRQDHRVSRAAPVTTEAPPPPAPTSGGGSGIADWDTIAWCESTGRWDLNTGNGYWGGLQFAPSTWFSNGGGPFDGSGPFPYSRAAQIAVAESVLATQGPGAWPNCFEWA